MVSSKPGFDIAALDGAVLETSLNVRINGDPFDEVIVATALHLDLPLIIKDGGITDSELVEILWYKGHLSPTPAPAATADYRVWAPDLYPSDLRQNMIPAACLT